MPRVRVLDAAARRQYALHAALLRPPEKQEGANAEKLPAEYEMLRAGLSSVRLGDRLYVNDAAHEVVDMMAIQSGVYRRFILKRRPPITLEVGPDVAVTIYRKLTQEGQS